MADIYLWIDGKQEGPYTEAQVRQFHAEGRVPGALLAWRDGLEDWIRVDALLAEAAALTARQPEGNSPTLKLVTGILPMIDRWRTSRKLTLAAAADHVELSATHLVIGLKIDWTNRTPQPITIKDVQVALTLAKGGEPLRFFPLERFGHSYSGRGRNTTPLCTFTLPGQQTHTEHLRFISQRFLDLPAGTYPAEFLAKDVANAEYHCAATLQVEDAIKRRLNETP